MVGIIIIVLLLALCCFVQFSGRDIQRAQMGEKRWAKKRLAEEDADQMMVAIILGALALLISAAVIFAFVTN